MMFTNGGSPIHYNAKRFFPKHHTKTLYECSKDSRHKLTKNQASSSGYYCTHCGSELKVRQQKLEEFRKLNKSLFGCNKGVES